nr:MAG TPA: hypothetical protein [Caudoviricetes sp.]
MNLLLAPGATRGKLMNGIKSACVYEYLLRPLASGFGASELRS